MFSPTPCSTCTALGGELPKGPGMIRADFLGFNLFGGRYQRNNKAKGRKNLRCCPSCRSTGHVKYGLCGRTVRINFACGAKAAEELDILAFAQFRVCSPATTGVLLGSTFPFTDIVHRSRGTSHSRGGNPHI
jgi:hypothetical protein